MVVHLLYLLCGGSKPVSPVWGDSGVTLYLPVSPVWWGVTRSVCVIEGCFVAVPGLCEVFVSPVSRSCISFSLHMPAQAMDSDIGIFSANWSFKLDGPPF